MKLRLFKMSETDKNMLLVALHIIFKGKRENGEDYNPIGHFILRIGKTANNKLYLNDEEFIWARNALNLLRNQYLAAGRYSDGIDYVMMKLMKAKYKRYKESKAKTA